MKKIFFVFLMFIFFILVFLGFRYYQNKSKEKKTIQARKNLIADIKNNYSDHSITVKDTNFYLKNNDSYTKSAKVSKDFLLSIEMTDSPETPYYKIVDTDFYIYYKDIKKSEQEIVKDDRYKYFVPFDYSVIVKKETKLYLKDGSYIITDKDFETPLLVKNDDDYGIEYLNNLFFVNKNDVDIKNNITREPEKAKKVLTLTYHFIYDPDETKCTQSICQTLELFESHLKYLTDNNYFIMKLDELEMYIDGKIQIPYNSIVLTIDDGYISEKAISLLEQYKVYATLFVITGHFDDFSKFKSPYLDLQSHTNGMHKQWACGSMGNQGGALLCEKEETAIEDLKISQEKLGGSQKVVYLSYPFFDFNDHAINILKKSGFKMAFIGQWSQKGFSTVGTNKYKIPRLTVFNDTTVEQLKKALTY